MRTIPIRAAHTLFAFLFALLTSRPAAAQCSAPVGSGGGGMIPASGSGNGTFPGVLPSSPFVSTLNVTVPVGATALDSVVLRGLNHTWVGDLQFVLEDPAGGAHNIFCRIGAQPLGFSCDLNGDYTITNDCGCTPPVPLPSTCSGTTLLTPTAYEQHFGSWPSGANGIFNTPLNSIPIANGVWTLRIYDWASSDIGSLVSWELVFSTPGGNPPPPPTCAGAVSSDEGPHQEIVSSPVTLEWTASSCATTRRSRVRRVTPPAQSWSSVVWVDAPMPSNGWSSDGHTASDEINLAPGEYEWEAQSVNAAGSAVTAQPCTFCIPGRYCISPSPAGGFIPQSGALNGVWPTVLPTGPMVSTAFFSLPAGATQLVSVKLQGLVHSRIGDLQLVLVDPSGGRHNLLQLNDGAGGGSCATAISGDYVIVDKVSGLVTCSGYELSYLCAAFAPGEYFQEHGAWNSGDAGIFNTPLASIPISSGAWTLEVYDWDAANNNGSLASWTLCFDVGSVPTTYCTAGTSTNGCLAAAGATAQPSASLSNSCVINITNVEGQKNGVVFYGVTGRAASPWGVGSSSFLCVKAPTQRTQSQNSGGAFGTCSGVLSLDWNAYQSAHPSALGNPFSAGQQVNVQGWFRDPPAAKATNLSDALELTVVP